MAHMENHNICSANYGLQSHLLTRVGHLSTGSSEPKPHLVAFGDEETHQGLDVTHLPNFGWEPLE